MTDVAIHVYDLERFLGMIKLETYIVHVTLACMLLITLVAIWLHRPIYASLYNFFHIPLGKI